MKVEVTVDQFTQIVLAEEASNKQTQPGITHAVRCTTCRTLEACSLSTDYVLLLVTTAGCSGGLATGADGDVDDISSRSCM